MEETKENKLPSGYLMTVNDKIVFIKDGNIEENVLTIEEVKQIRNLLKTVLIPINPKEFEEGIDYIRLNNIVCRFIYTGMINNIDDIYMKVKDEYLFSNINMTTQKKPLSSVITEENSKTDDK